MKLPTITLIGVLVAIPLAAVGQYSTPSPAPSGTPEQPPGQPASAAPMSPMASPMASMMPMPVGSPAGGAGITIRLSEQNSSGETGTATLLPVASGTRVSISLKGVPSGITQPAHIHKGTCATLDPTPEYPLRSVTNGTSVTTVPVTLSTLLASPNAINVHKSSADIKTYVACGDIVRTSTGLPKEGPAGS